MKLLLFACCWSGGDCTCSNVCFLQHQPLLFVVSGPLGPAGVLHCCSVQELEARLLQTEREKDNVRAQLHEMQLTLRAEGEFGNAGKKIRWACRCCMPRTACGCCCRG